MDKPAGMAEEFYDIDALKRGGLFVAAEDYRALGYDFHRCRDELEAARCLIVNLNRTIVSLELERKANALYLERLRELKTALRKYGVHTSLRCLEGGECDCGLSAILEDRRTPGNEDKDYANR